jgi:hypothetical protein
MVVTSFILGIVGSITGVLGLGWSVVTWRRSGPVVRVTVKQAFPTYADHLGEPLICVTAQNSGRAPVTISSWGLRLPDGQTMMITEPFPLSNALPYRLEEGTSGSWYTDTLRVVEACKAHGVDYADLIAYVDLGNGQSVDAKRRGIQLGPGFPWSTAKTADT